MTLLLLFVTTVRLSYTFSRTQTCFPGLADIIHNIGEAFAAYVWSFPPLIRRGCLLYSRGLNDEAEEEDADDEEAEEKDMSEEHTPPPQSSRRVWVQRERAIENKPITVDEKGEPYGALVGAFHADLRALARDLDPNGNFAEHEEATKERFFKRLWQGTTWLFLQ